MAVKFLNPFGARSGTNARCRALIWPGRPGAAAVCRRRVAATIGRVQIVFGDQPLKPQASNIFNCLAFGIERIGLVSLRFPVLVGIAATALVIAGAIGIGRLKVDDSLSQLFRSDTPEFRQYQQETRRFPSSEFDVLVVAEGKTLLQRNSIQALSNLATDLQLINGARGAISIFSARSAPENGKVPGPLFPEPLPEGETYKQLMAHAMSNGIIRGKLLSENGHLTLMVLALDPDVAESSHLRT